MTDLEKVIFGSASGLVALLVIWLILFSLANVQAFSDCVSYGNKPADCRVALD